MCDIDVVERPSGGTGLVLLISTTGVQSRDFGLRL